MGCVLTFSRSPHILRSESGGVIWHIYSKSEITSDQNVSCKIFVHNVQSIFSGGPFCNIGGQEHFVHMYKMSNYGW